MARKIETRSGVESKDPTGKVVLDPIRQAGRDFATGRFISNRPLVGSLPTYLIGQQMNITYFNDIDVEAFSRKVRHEVTRIREDIKDERFDEAAIKYQQFIDHYDACFEMPSLEGLKGVKDRGIDLYSILEHHGVKLMDELNLKNQPSGELARRFTGITDAHINLFFYMLILNLAIHNQIDGTQGQLRIKLKQFEDRLLALLKMYIYGDNEGQMWRTEIPASETLYGWILLRQNNLSDALEVFNSDMFLGPQMDFASLHAEVYNAYNDNSYAKVEAVKRDVFIGRGMSDLRVNIALKITVYLQQIKQIRRYIDELTQGSDSPESNEATVDIKSLLVSGAAEN